MVSLKSRIKIAFTIDVDGDVSLREQGAYSNATWDILHFLPELERTLRGYGPQGYIKLTWFIRADNHIKALTGDSCQLFNSLTDFWQQMRTKGDELAWHAHLCRKVDNDWIQETEPAILEELLRNIHSDIEKTSWKPKSIRIGESFHSNALMGTIHELGLSVDSTAIPGRKRQDELKSIDWEVTSNDAYFPNRNDYRSSGSPHWNVLEIPMTSILVKAPYDKEPILRYCNLSYKHDCIRTGLSAALEVRPYIVIILHPDEVVTPKTSSAARNELISYSMENLIKNMKFVIEKCGRLDRDIEFCTLTELAKDFVSNVKI